jgi:5-deoxy-glucuronate isomerase
MNQQSTQARADCSMFRGTHRVKGRKRIIDQTNSGLDFLRYGRTVVDGDAVEVDTGEEEIAFFCAGGTGEILVGNETYTLGKYDALYVPRESRCRLSSSGKFDVVEAAAPSSKKYPVQLVRFEDIKKDPEKAKDAGFPPYSRKLHTVVGEDNVQAARVLCGVTFSEDGNWTSWPPHQHDEWKEEIYLYVDMPEPNFGLHLNYTDPKAMDMVEPVWEGDAVAVKRGYHYNVATPGTKIGFIWMMAAIREEEDRKFSTVSVQPEFAGDRFKLF